MALATVMEIDPRKVPEIDAPDWFQRYQAWAAERGWKMEDWCLCAQHRASAPTPDSGIVSVDCGSDQFEHSIVIQGGKLFYDPALAGEYYFQRPWRRFTRLTPVT
jgi:hypothetical protein